MNPALEYVRSTDPRLNPKEYAAAAQEIAAQLDTLTASHIHLLERMTHTRNVVSRLAHMSEHLLHFPQFAQLPQRAYFAHFRQTLADLAASL